MLSWGGKQESSGVDGKEKSSHPVQLVVEDTDKRIEELVATGRWDCYQGTQWYSQYSRLVQAGGYFDFIETNASWISRDTISWLTFRRQLV